ncbi:MULTISPECIES: LytTR family DNA-binding domain-containing protein [unclassified Exiguobacterium]|uniref:LytTR family DNA-binding domain-containing protein n=1 Tax=unclassified Exiguobacterium TaxID=2644629 RepID=UPI001BEBA49C|nr:MULTISPECIES: LytTR family DNA-binding domain-containing protein [unclassified Exiguobacterium]
MKIKLDISNERYDKIKSMLEEKGIEIDDTADLVLSTSTPFVQHLTVKEKDTNERIVLPVADIICIESFGHTVEIETQASVYVATDRLYRLVSLLDPTSFLRISNSVVIATNQIKQIKPTLSTKFILTLTNGKRVDVTRSYYYIFKDHFHI